MQINVCRIFWPRPYLPEITSLNDFLSANDKEMEIRQNKSMAKRFDIIDPKNIHSATNVATVPLKYLITSFGA